MIRNVADGTRLIRVYDDLEELIRAVESARDLPDRYTQNDAWMGSESESATIQRLRNPGHDPILSAATKRIDASLRGHHVQRVRARLDVHGIRPNVAAFLAGSPRSMVRYTRETLQPICRVGIAIGGSSATTAEAIAEAGATIAEGVIQASHTVKVELIAGCNWCSGIEERPGWAHRGHVFVGARIPTDASAIMAVCRPDYFRRLGIKLRFDCYRNGYSKEIATREELAEIGLDLMVSTQEAKYGSLSPEEITQRIIDAAR